MRLHADTYTPGLRIVWGMRVRTAGFFIAIAAMSVASCSRSSSTEQRSSEPAISLAARVAAQCGNLKVPRLGTGTLCVDTQFQPKRDDFSFRNFGRTPRADENVTAQTLIDLFGYDTVCIPGSPQECVMRPPAVQLLERWNTALAGGRCEGLAILSTRFFLSQEHPQNYAVTAARTSDLTAFNRTLSESVVYWWATQFLDEVSRAAENSRNKSPLLLVDELIDGLARSSGYTMAMYFGNSGHSVTPFAVTKRDSDFVIHVYDNNFPGKRREILVNSVTNTWLYLAATESVDGTPVDWSGATGTLELTKMSERTGPFTCPFCTAMTKDSPSVVTLASRDPENAGYLYIESKAGTFEVTPQGITNSIRGATWTMSKGNRGLISVQIPPSVTSFSVAVNKESPDAVTGDVVLSVERAGFARLQVVGNLAVSQVATKPVTLVKSSSKQLQVVAPDSTKISVSIARRGTLATHSLQPNHDITFSRVNDNTISVGVKGMGGESSVTVLTSAVDTSERVKIFVDQAGSLALETSKPTAITARRQRSVTFTPTPRPKPQPTTSLPTIEISEPD